MGRWNDALQRYQSIPASRFNRPNFELAICYAHIGEAARARVILVELEKLAQERYVDHTHIAAIHAALGDNDRAFVALDQAFQDRSARVYAPRFYPWLSPLREDPRFVELENKVANSQLPSSTDSISQTPEKSIAVLPFDNLSDDKENAYFAVGIQDQILSSLGKVADLRVISRASVMHYTDGRRNLPQIAEALHVAHVLQGSIQRAGNKVRVTAQLIDARKDSHLWARTYDRDLADVFAIQTEIAMAITDQLQARLTALEAAALEEQPTKDLTAFEQYSRARTLFLEPSTGGQDTNLFHAVKLLNSAIRRDGSFYLAYCQLASVHCLLYARGFDHTPARLRAAEATLERIAQLRPDAAETHLAKAEHLYYTRRDYAAALAELARARHDLPNDPRIVATIGFILRRQGKHAEALGALQDAVTRDPRNLYSLAQLALSYQYLRQPAQVQAVLQRAAEIAPDDIPLAGSIPQIDLLWRGDPAPLHRFLDKIRKEQPNAIGTIADYHFICALAERDWGAAEQALLALGTNPFWNDWPINLSRNFGEGLLARAMGDEERARRAFTAARAEQEQIVQQQMEYGPPLGVLGLIDAALGNKEAALQEGRRALELLPIEKDATDGRSVLACFALTAAWAGEKDMALQQLAAVVSTVGAGEIVSYGSLKLLPFWESLHGDPRFEKIVASLAPK
jgi:TolB-like protein